LSASDSGDAAKTAVTDDLWHFYDEHATQARQHETLRATVTTILTAIAAAVTALAGVGGLTLADVPAGMVVVAVSGLGIACNLKHFERNRFHAQVMWQVQQEIERLTQSSRGDAKAMSTLWETAKRVHGEEFSARKGKEKGRSVWVRIRLYALWAGLPMAIGIVGLLVIVLGIVGVSGGR